MVGDVPCRQAEVSRHHRADAVHSAVSAAAAAEVGTRRRAAAAPADAVSVPALCAAVQRGGGPAQWTSGSVAPLHSVKSHALGPIQTYTSHTDTHSVQFSLEIWGPIYKTSHDYRLFCKIDLRQLLITC